MLKKKSFLSVLSFMLALLMFLLSFPTAATTISEKAPEGVNKASKIDKALLEVMAEASSDEKIPVAIWYNDIDQAEVDTLTVEKVGFDRDSVSLDYEMPSAELLTSLKAGEAGAEAEMQAYLERTESKRLEEKQRTDNYIMSRREISREKYNEKTASVLTEIAIPEEDIVFRSQYAPMIIAELTPAEIISTSTCDSLERIYYEVQESDEIKVATEQNENTRSTSADYVNKMNIIKKVLGYTDLMSALQQMDSTFAPGDGITIGVVENGGTINEDDPELSESNISHIGTPDLSHWNVGHMTGTVRIIASKNYGFANAADIVYSDTDYESLEILMGMGVHLINVSGYLVSFDYTYTSNARWYEHLVSHHGLTIVAAAGNKNREGEGAEIIEPAICYNSIGVGAYYLGSSSGIVTENKTDDTLYTHSSNISLIGNAKPDVIMPYPNGGTSYATPILTSFIAIMYQIKPSLALYPQVVKAIVLASCHRKVNPSVDGEPAELMTQGITDRQGAGAPDVFAMVSIVTQGTYGVGVINVGETEKYIRFTQPSYGANNMNFSITWLRDSDFVDEDGDIIDSPDHSEDSLQVRDAVDLDLTVYRNGTYVKDSSLLKSSTEMAYFPLDDENFDYMVRIDKSSHYEESIKYGYAYSTDYVYNTDNPTLSITEGSGIYRLKNLETGTYATLDTTTNELKLQNYTDSAAQMWIRKPNDMKLYPGAENIQGNVHYGNSIGTYSRKAVVGSTNVNLSIYSWLDNPNYGIYGATSIFTYVGGTQLYLSHSGNDVVFSSQSETTDARYWILEKIDYRLYDANLDGLVSVEDADYIGLYLSGLRTMNNIQLYLADANGDDVVNLQDRTIIQSFFEED